MICEKLRKVTAHNHYKLTPYVLILTAEIDRDLEQQQKES